MRCSSKSLKTVSFNTRSTSDDMTNSLVDVENGEEIVEENDEEPICQNAFAKYALHYMVGFVIIASGIWIGIYYLTKNS